MINNRGLRDRRLGTLAFALFVFASGCARTPKHAGALQGVIEFDERVLGFETGGRVTRVAPRRGDAIHAGDILATLDDTLGRTSRQSREAEAAAARARAALIKAGSRPEEIRAIAAQVRAAQAYESLLQKQLERDRALFSSGASTQANLDELDSRLERAVAEREVIEQRQRELRGGARTQEIESAEAQAAAAATAVELEAERVRRHELAALDDGTVLDVHVEQGEVVVAGTPVVTVADTTHPYVDIFVPQGELDGIHVGRPAAVHVDATAEVFRGTVDRVGRRTEFTPRWLFSERERPALVIRVRVRIEDPGERLHAGVPAFVYVELVGHPPAPHASATAVVDP
jgi:HlyD family secretion protein